MEITTHQSLAKKLGWNDTDLYYADIFWNVIKNNEEFPLNENIVHNWFGYKKCKNMMSIFYQEMLLSFNENVDYRILKDPLEQNEFIEKWEKRTSEPFIKNYRTKFVVATGKCIKQILMKTKTKKGEEIRDYYLKTEELAKSLINSVKCIEKSSKGTQTFYLKSSKEDAKRGWYKFGFTVNNSSSKRTQQLNTGRAPDDPIETLAEFSVVNAKHVEDRVREILSTKLDNKRRDWVSGITYEILYNICKLIIDSYNDELDYIEKNT